MEINLTIAAQATERWQSRSNVREPNLAKLSIGRVAEVESPERIQLRLNRLAEAATRGIAASAVLGPEEDIGTEMPSSTPSLVETVGLERVMGRSDFLGINFLELALAVSRFVGRINIRFSPDRTAGFGTGFMISPRLLLTNNHVLRDKEAAVHSEVEFDYQYDRNGRLLPVVVFALEPETLFLTSQELDYTLVAVRERSLNGIDVKRYGWTRLIGAQGKALLGDSLNIIQHPKGEAKQIVLRSNQLVDLFDRFAHYVTDTEPGSSGSPVYNDQWELVALHHSGVPKRENGNYLAKDGSVWRPGMDPEDLEWVANEGIRVSSLVEHIKGQPLETPLQHQLRDDLLELEPPDPIEAARMAAAAGSHRRSRRKTSERKEVTQPNGGPLLNTAELQTISWTIPLEVTVRLGAPMMVGEPISVSGSATRLPDSTSLSGLPAPSVPTPALPRSQPPALREALLELEAASAREYYSEARDQRARETYYQEVTAHLDQWDAVEVYRRLSELTKKTHKNPLRYQPALHLYPWVDLHEARPKPVLKSIYSGQSFDPRDFIEADFRIEQERARLQEVLLREASLSILTQEQLDLVEASLPFNCEHVVPQSWFGKREPMKGDLHHLFACEIDCNSFRSNIPYFDFADFEEAIRDACGKREEGRFEPSAGKGAVARATLYFLLRYPKEINRTHKEYTEDRIRILLDWHERFPVTRYELHRNAAIFEKQGNRNPLIDFPDWAGKMDFTHGLG
jgi:endonuclease G, mitochondrial